MKKINVWKVAVYNILTLGIYSIIWTVKRRDEMVTTYKQSIPSASWFIVAAVSYYVLSIVSYIDMFFGNDITSVVTALIVLPLLLAAFIIGIWWMWKFSKAAAYVTGGRMPAGWTLVLFILTESAVVSLFLQYFFNRAEQPSKLSSKTEARSSVKFKLVALLVILAASGLAIWVSILTFPTEEIQQTIDQQSEMTTWQQKASQLAGEHKACVTKLDQDFKEVTSDNETAYQKAFDACEVIRKEQNKAVDEYNRLMAE